MNSWSRKRKRIILSLIVFVLVFLVAIPIFLLVYRAPTCSDGFQNGDETGVDCGGSCHLLCTSDSLPLISQGDPRILKVRDNSYEVVVMVENPNANAYVYRASYKLKLFENESSVPIKIIDGETFVPKGSNFAIFEGPFQAEENHFPIKATIEWIDESIVWQKDNRSVPDLVISSQGFSRVDSTPRLDALLENNSLENVKNIDLIALISNESGNVFAASKTFVDEVPAGGRVPVVFVWPEAFMEQIVGTNIVVRILPSKSFIK